MRRDGLHRLTLCDLDALLALQTQTLPDTLSARLGNNFNALYHRSMLREELFLCDGYFVDGTLAGYVSYTPTTLRLLRSALRHHMLAYGIAVARALLGNPKRWGMTTRIARSVFAGRAEPAPHVEAELLSIGVLPAFRGRPAREGATRLTVASILLEHALASLRARGARAVKACVTRDDPIANRFYVKQAFTLQGAAQRFGLVANLYVRELDEPTSVARHA